MNPFFKLTLRLLKRIFGIEIINKVLVLSDAGVNAEILKMFGAKIGRDVGIHSPLHLYNTGLDYSHLKIGDNVLIGKNVYIDLTDNVILKKGVSLGPNVSIMTHNAYNNNKLLEKNLAHQCGKGKVIIGEGSGIKVGSSILKGVTVGKNSVVAAGAIVTKDVPDYRIVMGVPAKITYNTRTRRKADK